MSLSCKNINREENEVKMLDLMSQVYGGKDPERTAEQWLREHKDVKKGQNNFLISLFLQEEEDFFRTRSDMKKQTHLNPRHMPAGGTIIRTMR